MLPPELAAQFAELIRPPRMSPLDYAPVTTAEVTEMAFLCGWLPSRDRPRYLPVAVPAGPP